MTGHMPPTIYLDTKDLSALVRQPTEPGPQIVRRLLSNGDAAVAVSIMHLHELSHPTFADREAVGQLLDDMPKTWCIHLPDLFDQEIVAAKTRCYDPRVITPQVFHSDIQEAWDMPDDAVIPIVDMLDAFASRPDLRLLVSKVATWGALQDRLKGDAAVIRDPRIPFQVRVQDMIADGKLVLPEGVTTKELYDLAGGLSGLPSYQVFQSLIAGRLGDTRFKPRRNDLIDEWHVCYAPYAAVTVVDRRTLGRCKSAQLPCVDRIARSLSDVEPLLRDRGC